MIKFACPGCAEVYSVEDAKAGKSGKCPKCQADFVIPQADASVPAASSDPSAPPVEIRPCPGCHAKLSVNAGDVGKDVECPYCKSTFRAMASAGQARQSGAASDTVEDDRPRRSGERRERYDDDGEYAGTRRNRHLEPHRGSTVLTLVLVGFFCCVILTIAGTIMATIDLGKMKKGTMDPEGKGLTQAAQIIGFIAIGLNILVVFGQMMIMAAGR
jgi:hypothetical protein